jgi:hypothetical protein
VENFSKIAKPISDLRKKGIPSFGKKNNKKHSKN